MDAMCAQRRVLRPWSWRHAVLALYFPIGVVVLVLRLVLLSVFTPFAACLPIPACLMRGLGIFLTGMVVTVSDKRGNTAREEAPVVVMNHRSEFDPVAVRAALGRVVITGYAFYKSWWWLKLCTPFYHLFEVGWIPQRSRSEGGGKGRDEVRKMLRGVIAAHAAARSPSAVDGGSSSSNRKARRKAPPLLLFPEGGLTEGAAGLLEYHKFVFSLGVPVQVLALTVKPGPLPLSVNNELGTTLGNLACAFFVPWRHFHVDILPVMRAAADESGGGGGELDDAQALAFARDVAATTAKALGVKQTGFLYRQKRQYFKLKAKLVQEHGATAVQRAIEQAASKAVS